MDGTDLRILEILQRDARATQHEIARRVKLSQPSVADRIHKLEARGVILAYIVKLDPEQLGKDITAFIGVGIEHPRYFDGFASGSRSWRTCSSVTGSPAKTRIC